MKIALLSDVHLEVGDWSPPTYLNADVVVLAGDIHSKGRGVAWAREHFTQPVIYVPGNHEFWKSSNWEHELNRLRQNSAGSNVTILNNEEVTLNGVRFVGTTLWADYRLNGVSNTKSAAREKLNDFKFIRANGFKRTNPEWQIAQHERAKRYLEEALTDTTADNTVVVTHHAPSYCSLPDNKKDDALAGAYASDLTHLMGKAMLWLHGHVHSSNDYVVNGTRVVSNPRGPLILDKKGKPAPGGDHRNQAFNENLLLEL